MLKLIEGNVQLKPSHRRQLLTCLKRIQRLGQRLGDFVLTLSLRRSGKALEVRAVVHDSAGDFECRLRQQDWRRALQDLARTLYARVHAQFISQASFRRAIA
jgi:hypothetical protein